MISSPTHALTLGRMVSLSLAMTAIERASQSPVTTLVAASTAVVLAPERQDFSATSWPLKFNTAAA